MIKKIQSTDGRRLFKIVFKINSNSRKHVGSTLVDERQVSYPEHARFFLQICFFFFF